MKQTFVLEADDLQFGAPGFEDVLRLKEHYPALKFTFFMIPVPSILLERQAKPDAYREWAKYLKQDWIEICPHGFAHQEGEMSHYYTRKGNRKEINYKTANLLIDASEKTFKELDLPFKKIWRSPYWETSKEAYRALFDRGYVVAVDPNQPTPEASEGGKIYKYNWSYDSSPPPLQLVRGHGHLYGQNKNTIRRCVDNLLRIPEDAEFKFASEVIDG